MNPHHSQSIIAFEGSRALGRGPAFEVVLAVKRAVESPEHEPVLVFDDVSSQPIELDLRGTDEAILGRLAVDPEPDADDAGERPPIAKKRGPGRPKLGVVAREVTLLPRHWAWLGEQPGGASVTLRKLVEAARRSSAERIEQRRAQESAYRFMSAMAGNAPGFEEATRALFAGAADRFEQQTEAWPPDVREHAVRLAARAFRGRGQEGDSHA